MHPAKLFLALAISALAPTAAMAQAKAQAATADVAPVPGGTLPGTYSINGDTTDVLIVEPIEGRTFRLRRPGEWEGVGVFDGRVLWGAFRYGQETAERHLAGSTGGFRALANAEGGFDVQGAFVYGWSGRFTGTWDRLADLAPAPVAIPAVVEPPAAVAPAQPDVKH